MMHYNSSSSSVALIWSANDTDSSYARSQVWVDDPSNVMYNGSTQFTTLTGLEEGLRLVNITVFDLAGNTASTQIIIRVDLTNPSLAITNPVDSAVTGSSFTVEWEVSDKGVGYNRAIIYLDATIIGTIFAPNSTLRLTGLEQGSHSINVTVYDWAGRCTSKDITINVFHLLDFPWSTFLLGFGMTCIVVYVLHHQWYKSR
jgi:hypothetical protein